LSANYNLRRRTQNFVGLSNLFSVNSYQQRYCANFWSWVLQGLVLFAMVVSKFNGSFPNTAYETHTILSPPHNGLRMSDIEQWRCFEWRLRITGCIRQMFTGNASEHAAK